MQKRRIEMRIQRLTRRASRVERWLADLTKWQPGRHGPFRAFILQIIDEDPDATEEEIVGALVEKVDELMSFSGLAEIISDIGLRAAAWLALHIYKNRESLLRQRLERLRERIATLREALDRIGPKGSLGGDDELAIFRELGMDEKFLLDEPRN